MVDYTNGNGHAEIQKRIDKLEEEVKELKPNGSCRQVRLEADALLAKIEKLKERQLEQQEI